MCELGIWDNKCDLHVFSRPVSCGAVQWHRVCLLFHLSRGNIFKFRVGSLYELHLGLLFDDGLVELRELRDRTVSTLPGLFRVHLLRLGLLFDCFRCDVVLEYIPDCGLRLLVDVLVNML